tara:strand:+ start:227 stop:625 length:399 start_codon:yes stop_codon:yes gene_type:complete
MDLVTSLDDLVRAQEHLLRVKALLKNNRFEKYLYESIIQIESELDRQIRLTREQEVKVYGEREPFSPIVQEKETSSDSQKSNLYDVLEEQTNGWFPPDSSYSSLSRESATSKYEELMAGGVNPNNIKIVRIK